MSALTAAAGSVSARAVLAPAAHASATAANRRMVFMVSPSAAAAFARSRTRDAAARFTAGLRDDVPGYAARHVDAGLAAALRGRSATGGRGGVPRVGAFR